MTDYPNNSRDERNESPFAPNAASGSAATGDRQAASFGDLQEKATKDFNDLKDAAKTGASKAMETTADMAEEKKNVVADQLAGVAEALEKVGREMTGGDHAMVARYARDLGGSARRIATDLKGRDMGDVVAMAEDFGRRQPVAFLGLSALAGLAASRFVTASSKRNASTGDRSRAGASVTARGEGEETSANPMAGRLMPEDELAAAAGSPERQPRPGIGAAGTGIGGTGLGTSPERPSSTRETPTLSPSPPSSHPPGRVSIGGNAAGSTTESSFSTSSQTYNAAGPDREGRSNV